MPTPREKFQGLLKKLFQFDCAELDFGIYRIMNHKRAVIEQFIEKDLLDGVAMELTSGALAEESGLAQQLTEVAAQIKENFGEEALDAEGNLAAQYQQTPRGKQYLELQERTGKAKSRPELEAEIFNHLYSFFSRYYDEGDFMSLRRYSKRDKYAIPYNGEEVHLHWANSDQYYIKTGENFTDYSYKHGGWAVCFKLRNADVEQNNVKGAKRFFLPRAADAALDAKARTLSIPFEYRPLTEREEITYKSKPQETILAEAAPKIVVAVKSNTDALAALLHEKRKDVDGNPVSLLDHHLHVYTRKNTSDFFIHKDLKGFLERELDFYLKNEVLNLDELEAGGEARSESWFQTLRAIKGIGRKIIAFVAQIENFQKLLFEKKKFVTEVNYCVTLDRVPEELYPEVAKNKAQIEEWKRLFHVHKIEGDLATPGFKDPPKVDFLKAQPSLVLDTKFFSSGFIEKLLASKRFLYGADSVDEALDGLLIHSDNFQALRLIEASYRDGVDITFIDPPYNTGLGDFNYKDSYQHSSWIAMMADRLRSGKGLLRQTGTLWVTLDDGESSNFRSLGEKIFGANCFKGEIAWEKVYSPRMDAVVFSSSYDHLFVFSKAPDWSPNRLRITPDLDQFPHQDEKDRKYRSDPLRKWGKGSLREDRPNLWFLIKSPKGIEVWPIKPDGTEGRWRWERKTVEKRYAELDWLDKGNGLQPYVRQYADESDTRPTETIWKYTEAGSTHEAQEELKVLIPNTSFTTPKPTKLVAKAIQAACSSTSVVLDFFGGSGTTGHAVVELNRQDEGERKYILVEMGEYFGTVLKPRLQKVIYSKDWKDGKPVSRQGSSHAFKYLRLESYEDALDNITFQTPDKQTTLQLEDYVLGYMLDFETKQSDTLLNVAKLDAPFDYTLRRQGKDEPLPVDLPETFNYLIGLHVASRRVYENKSTRYLVYRGRAESRETAILWRTTRGWGEKEFEADKEFVKKHKLTDGAEDIFVNTDSFIPGARSLDPVFKRRMFNEE